MRRENLPLASAQLLVRDALSSENLLAQDAEGLASRQLLASEGILASEEILAANHPNAAQELQDHHHPAPGELELRSNILQDPIIVG